MTKMITKLFADRVEVQKRRFMNGYTVMRITTTWSGKVRSVEVLEKKILWTL
jgi:hypothetical protein